LKINPALEKYSENRWGANRNYSKVLQCRAFYVSKNKLYYYWGSGLRNKRRKAVSVRDYI